MRQTIYRKWDFRHCVTEQIVYNQDNELRKIWAINLYLGLQCIGFFNYGYQDKTDANNVCKGLSERWDIKYLNANYWPIKQDNDYNYYITIFKPHARKKSDQLVSTSYYLIPFIGEPPKISAEPNK